MAGTYPDAPGHRMAYDRDGTVGFTINGAGVVSTVSAADLAAANDEDSDVGISVTPTMTTYIGLIFPELRDIDGIFWAGEAVNDGSFWPIRFQVSTNTTNGLDGTWSTLVDIPANTTITPNYRSGITAASASGVRAIRSASVFGVRSDGWHYWRAVHVYGSPSSAADRLRFWHPTLNQEVDGAYFDWGDVARSSILDRDFRIKNPSGSVTANSVSVSIEALTDTTPANLSQHTLSTDGTTFTSTASVGTLAPGAVSDVVTLRRDTTSDAVLSVWTVRLVASASSYT